VGKFKPLPRLRSWRRFIHVSKKQISKITIAMIYFVRHSKASEIKELNGIELHKAFVTFFTNANRVLS